MEAGELDLKKDIPMTEGEILALEGDGLRVAVGKLAGWTVADNNSSQATEPGGRYRMALPHFDSSLDAIRPVVEKAVEECEPDAYFLPALETVVGSAWRIKLVMASATDLARAVLLAYHRHATAQADSQVGEALEPEKPTSQGDQKESPERP